MNEENGMVSFEGGARRADRKPPLFLCPIELIEEVAKTRLEGDLKYEPGNWQSGDVEFFLGCNSHAITHLLEMVDTDNEEDILTHLGHAACNIAFMIWAVRRQKISRRDFLNFANFTARGREKTAALTSGAI